jgi:hypothetical protein
MNMLAWATQILKVPLQRRTIGGELPINRGTPEFYKPANVLNVGVCIQFPCL